MILLCPDVLLVHGPTILNLSFKTCIKVESKIELGYRLN